MQDYPCLFPVWKINLWVRGPGEGLSLPCRFHDANVVGSLVSGGVMDVLLAEYTAEAINRVKIQSLHLLLQFPVHDRQVFDAVAVQ